MSDSAADRVTAIVVNYNGGDLLTDCVTALLAAPGVGSLLLIDNASSDDSVAAVEEKIGGSDRLHVVRNEANIGYGAAVNLALRRVAGEFALVVNPDCVVGEDLLATLLAEANATPRAAICGGLVLSSDGRLQNATRRDYPSPSRALRRALRWPTRSGSRLATADFDRVDDPLASAAHDVDAVSGALMLLRMSAVREVGGFDEAYFLHCEDLDLCVRLKRAGWRVRFVPAGFAVHAKGASGGVRPWRIRWYMHQGMTRFYRKFEAPSRNWTFNALVYLGIWARFTVGVLAHPVRTRLRPLPSYSSAVHSTREVRTRIGGFRRPTTLLIGVTSSVARYLLEAPSEEGVWQLAVSRSQPPIHLDDGIVWMRSEDGSNLPQWARQELRRVVHLAPLWTLLPYLENLADAPLERVVACSSTSVVTRRNALDGVAQRLSEAEEAIQKLCADRGIELVLLRPTLIYAPGRDRNVEVIARLVRRLGFFPLAGYGTGLRQPVHAEDVAQAVRASLSSPRAVGRCYTVSGGEVLTYREMVERVFRASGREPRILTIPVRPYRFALLALTWLFRGLALDPAAAARMDDDHSLDHQAAARDLDFRPRAFLER